MPEDQFRTVANVLTFLLAIVVPSWRSGYCGACYAALLYWVFGIVLYEIISVDPSSSGFARAFHLVLGWCPPLVVGVIAAAIRQRRRQSR